jgi:hypothetical protein
MFKMLNFIKVLAAMACPMVMAIVVGMEGVAALLP